MPSFAGIGSRQTPDQMLRHMTVLGERYAKDGWTLHSGGAQGADAAFESGCDFAGGSKMIFLPWKGFNKHPSPYFEPPRESFALAETLHPAWQVLSYGAKKLHARNCQQILGLNLDSPVSLVLCWTDPANKFGGTLTAMKLASSRGIRVVNLFTEEAPDPSSFKEAP